MSFLCRKEDWLNSLHRNLQHSRAEGIVVTYTDRHREEQTISTSVTPLCSQHTISTDDGTLVVDIFHAGVTDQLCIDRVYDCNEFSQRRPTCLQVHTSSIRMLCQWIHTTK